MHEHHRFQLRPYPLVMRCRIEEQKNVAVARDNCHDYFQQIISSYSQLSAVGSQEF